MATGMHMDERSVDCLVLGHHDQDRKVSAKSVTMRAMALCKNLSGYRELLLMCSLCSFPQTKQTIVIPGLSYLTAFAYIFLLGYVQKPFLVCSCYE